MSLTIDDLKVILIQKSFSEFKAALQDFDLTSSDNYGNNIFHYYARNHTSVHVPVADMVQFFIDNGIDISAAQSKMPKRTALHFAVLTKAKEVFDELIGKGANVNAKDGNGNTPLSDAVFGYRNDDGYFIEALISAGANPDITNNYDVSPKSLAETISNYDTKKFFS